MSHKLVKNIDEEVWRKFTGFCKIKGVKVGKELKAVLKGYLEKNLRIK